MNSGLGVQEFFLLPGAFLDKVRAVILLQELAATILRSRGKSVRPWSASGSSV